MQLMSHSVARRIQRLGVGGEGHVVVRHRVEPAVVHTVVALREGRKGVVVEARHQHQSNVSWCEVNSKGCVEILLVEQKQHCQERLALEMDP